MGFINQLITGGHHPAWQWLIINRLRHVLPATMERAILYRLQTALAQAQQEHGFRVKHGVCG